MTIQRILQRANTLIDDNIQPNILLIYVNQGITKLNLDCNLKLPKVTMQDSQNDYVVSDEDFVNDMVAEILVQYVAYSALQTEGYTMQENAFYSEFVANKVQFNAKFKHNIKEEYRLDYNESSHMRKAKDRNTLPLFLRRTKLW